MTSEQTQGSADDGTEPDPRFTFANERTFLAWIRTGLALLGGGLAVAGFLPPLPIRHLREVLALSLMALGGARLWVLPNPSGLNAHWTLDAIAAEFAALRASAG